MGNCFSDPSKPPGKGQVLGSAPPPSTAAPARSGGTTQNTPARNGAPPRTLGSTSDNTVGGEGDARERALRAAEQRARSAQKKGVNASNPKAGQLSSKLASSNASPPPQQPNERMMDRGDWN